MGSSTSLEHHTNVTEVFRKLAAHGGGGVSFDLALDLVLNELVQLARDATGATGAAIALERDGQMVCRATTGGNAPDLGVRVETSSGLTGTCLQTGEVQLCSDTETDARVDAIACRQLGVRSMLIAPVMDGGRANGILEVFSDRAIAFAAHDIDTVRGLARKIADSQKGVVSEVVSPRPTESLVAELLKSPSAVPEHEEEVQTGETTEDSREGKRDVWTSVLVFLIIIVAVTLGVVIGWRQAAKNRTGTSASHPASAGRSAGTQSTVPSVAGAAMGAASDASSQPQQKTPRPSNSTDSGGLVITQGGKVIYRQTPVESVPAADTATEAARGRLMHRVEPQYPAEAKTRGIQGSVVLDVQVLQDGKVGSVQVVSGHPLLADAAVQAVKQWKYEPHSVDGQAIESKDRVTIRFTLPPG